MAEPSPKSFPGRSKPSPASPFRAAKASMSYTICAEQLPASEIERSLLAQARSWYAVYTASNREKRVEHYLRMKGVDVFLPLYSITKRWRNRTTVKVELPLFRGYLFVRIA